MDWQQLETGQIVQSLQAAGLSKRELIASQMDARHDIADYSLEYLEALTGRARPSAPTTAEELLKWDAECEAKIKVIKADALLTELSKPLP
jgi:hypothetical protein